MSGWLLQWEQWRPPTWTYPQSEKLDFSNLLVPTMDSTRALFLLQVRPSVPRQLARRLTVSEGAMAVEEAGVE